MHRHFDDLARYEGMFATLHSRKVENTKVVDFKVVDRQIHERLSLSLRNNIHSALGPDVKQSVRTLLARCTRGRLQARDAWEKFSQENMDNYGSIDANLMMVKLKTPIRVEDIYPEAMFDGVHPTVPIDYVDIATYAVMSDVKHILPVACTSVNALMQVGAFPSRPRLCPFMVAIIMGRVGCFEMLSWHAPDTDFLYHKLISVCNVISRKALDRAMTFIFRNNKCLKIKKRDVLSAGLSMAINYDDDVMMSELTNRCPSMEGRCVDGRFRMEEVVCSFIRHDRVLREPPALIMAVLVQASRCIAKLVQQCPPNYVRELFCGIGGHSFWCILWHSSGDDCAYVWKNTVILYHLAVMGLHTPETDKAVRNRFLYYLLNTYESRPGVPSLTRPSQVPIDYEYEAPWCAADKWRFAPQCWCVDDTTYISTHMHHAGYMKRAHLDIFQGPLVVSFGGRSYYVPDYAVLTFPTTTNRVESTEALGELLNGTTPRLWDRFVGLDRIILIYGIEGIKMYTTFKVGDVVDEGECVLLYELPRHVFEEQHLRWIDEIETLHVAAKGMSDYDVEDTRIKFSGCILAEWTYIYPSCNAWEICDDVASPSTPPCPFDSILTTAPIPSSPVAKSATEATEDAVDDIGSPSEDVHAATKGKKSNRRGRRGRRGGTRVREKERRAEERDEEGTTDGATDVDCKHDSDVPDIEEITCPITHCLFVDPVMLVGDMHVYSRRAIEEWLRRNNTSPLHNVEMLTQKDLTLVEMPAVASKVDHYRAVFPSVDIDECLKHE